MLEPVICPKCRTLSYIDYGRMKINNTLIKCSHFSEVIRQYERDKKQVRLNIEALKRLNEELEKEDAEIDRVLEEDITFPEINFGELRFSRMGELIGPDEDEEHVNIMGDLFPETDFLFPLDPLWNCRCRVEPIKEDRFIRFGKGLGYTVVPHPVTTGVKGFMYGFK